MPDLPSGAVTFLFTDIEGSTRLWEQSPATMELALARHDALLRAAIETNGGSVFKTVGDAFCAAFASAPAALAAALTAQRALLAERWSEPRRAHRADGVAHRQRGGARQRLFRAAAQPCGTSARHRPRETGTALRRDHERRREPRCRSARRCWIGAPTASRTSRSPTRCSSSAIRTCRRNFRRCARSRPTPTTCRSN